MRGRLLRDSALNAAGQGLPLLAAVMAVPVLVRTIGAERVGLLTLAWAVIGYFGLFDLGLSRSLTQAVAARHGQDRAETAALIRSALRLMAWLGVAGGAFLAAITDWVVGQALNIAPVLHDETRVAFYLLAVSVPAVVLTSGMRGVLEAHHRFDLVNAVRAPMGIFTFLAPLAVLPFTRSLAAIITVLLAGRLAGLVVHAMMCARVVPEMRAARAAWAPPLGPLLRNGGWMTVSNIVSPLMVTADRFLIASIASAAVVAFYTVPYEAASKVLILPVSIAAPLFARFGSLTDREAQADLMLRGSVLTAIAVFPATLLLNLAAPEGMTLWMGAEFAERSAPVLRLLGVGIFFNALAQVPFAMLQARGRADLTARFHLLELPVYLLAVVLLVRSHGIEGAAFAWTLRAVLDCVLLLGTALHLNPEARAATHRPVWAVVAGATVVTLVAATVPAAMPAARATYGGVALLSAAGIVRVVARSLRRSEAIG